MLYGKIIGSTATSSARFKMDYRAIESMLEPKRVFCKKKLKACMAFFTCTCRKRNEICKHFHCARLSGCQDKEVRCF